jgi:hypothetical protein
VLEAFADSAGDAVSELAQKPEFCEFETALERPATVPAPGVGGAGIAEGAISAFSQHAFHPHSQRTTSRSRTLLLLERAAMFYSLG